MKFKQGDHIVVSEYGNGFDWAIVTGVIEQKGRQYYTLKIMNGTATIPVSAEVNYKIAKDK
jgi:RNA polymerase-interacting CarD/CdnL/TRCF family regulator